MSLRIFVCSIVFLTGCTHTAQPVHSSAFGASHAANVFALVPVNVVAEPAPAPESDLADLDIEIPALEHDFQFRGHDPHGPARRCEGAGVTTTCGAAPANDDS